MDSGAVGFLLILGGNPVYNAPADFAFHEKLRKVKESVHVGLHHDETSYACSWHLPESHFLEAWGDTRAFDGTATIQQPLINPLYDSRSFIEVLDAVIQQPGRQGYDIVREYWSARAGTGDFEAWWRKSVHDGVVPNTAAARVNAAAGAGGTQAAAGSQAGGMELVFRPDPYLLDGRYANNPWLQELPRPISKLMWDNAVHISPRTAERLAVTNNDVVEMKFREQALLGPIWITPGQPDDSLTIHLGFGRTMLGRAANGAGFNAYVLRASDAMWAAQGVQVRKTGKTYALSTAQMHKSMEGRDLAVHTTLDEYRNDPAFAQKKVKEPDVGESLYPRWDYTGYAWGMGIDLTSCVNCMACVIACQAENNIAVVGKEQCLFNREMHWLRVDVYYEGNPSSPTAYYQPVPCMHCEKAPCELVCPVQATLHSAEGLNDMIYNRCVGTRYCSNNCPYKVRRFNFLLFSDWYTETWKMQRNPDVTVRSRGVMEKCSYCVQRIREAEIHARVDDRFVRDGEIETACQQACPTEAIIFGDINNPANQVSKWKKEKLNYSLLAELNTRPRTTVSGRGAKSES